MGFEITYPADHTLRNSEIIDILRAQYPGKDFSIHGTTITESYREQPPFQDMLEKSPWYRTSSGAGVRAVAVSERAVPEDYIARVMSNEV